MNIKLEKNIYFKNDTFGDVFISERNKIDYYKKKYRSQQEHGTEK